MTYYDIDLLSCNYSVFVHLLPLLPSATHWGELFKFKASIESLSRSVLHPDLLHGLPEAPHVVEPTGPVAGL